MSRAAGGNAYMRKKQPELVRQTILQAAEEIVAREGAAALTIQAVATAAGITKGGVTHHFANKQALIEAIFAAVLSDMDDEIDGILSSTGGQRGCFTRAYVSVLLTHKSEGGRSPFDAISLMSLSEPALVEPWDRWLCDRLERHRETDGDEQLEIVRLAADGAWLAYVGREPDAHLDRLRERLLAMTRG